jgi:hypothetical protein
MRLMREIQDSAAAYVYSRFHFGEWNCNRVQRPFNIKGPDKASSSKES